jgi:cyclic pyranopterin phosphate synthase
MEALTAVAIAALTVIDMGKAIDKGMTIDGLRVLEKHGGRTGSYTATTPHPPAPSGGVGRVGEARGTPGVQDARP